MLKGIKMLTTSVEKYFSLWKKKRMLQGCFNEDIIERIKTSKQKGEMNA